MVVEFTGAVMIRCEEVKITNRVVSTTHVDFPCRIYNGRGLESFGKSVDEDTYLSFKIFFLNSFPYVLCKQPYSLVRDEERRKVGKDCERQNEERTILRWFFDQ